MVPQVETKRRLSEVRAQGCHGSIGGWTSLGVPIDVIFINVYIYIYVTILYIYMYIYGKYNVG